jgi:hypothetical protein
MFSPWGVVYRFATEYLPGKVVTSLFRAARPGKEDRVARLEWDNSAGTLGKAVIGMPHFSFTFGLQRRSTLAIDPGRATMPMADLIKKDSATTRFVLFWTFSPFSSLHDES